MSNETQALTTTDKPEKFSGEVGFFNADGFEYMQRVAGVFSGSTLVPETFRGPQNKASCVIAIDMAHRMGANPLAVMQNIYIVHGKPSWASTFIIAVINTCGRFEPLRLDVDGTGEDRQCIAWTTAKGNILPPEVGTLAAAKAKGFAVFEGPAVSIRMANAEGWATKNGSKWKTMPDLMLRYRAATFFGRLYAPELLMGMKAQEEIHDIIDVPAERVTRATFSAPELKAIADAPVIDLPQNILANYMVEARVSFADFKDWLTSVNPVSGVNYEDIDGYETVPTKVCERLLSDEKLLAKCAKTFGKQP